MLHPNDALITRHFTILLKGNHIIENAASTTSHLPLTLRKATAFMLHCVLLMTCGHKPNQLVASRFENTHRIFGRNELPCIIYGCQRLALRLAAGGHSTDYNAKLFISGVLPVFSVEDVMVIQKSFGPRAVATKEG
ncbi:unnamed protein product [Phytophthora lilii]|uniref:Unnamed protein product n=1 Tax=Phytophthora lilii TaxID=2077276 RepID=A0A9W6TNH7_9STRA|nr:unnamed protein product [Phytophthora lilii]